MSYPTELLSPFPAEPSGDSAENEPAATVTDPTIHEETYRLDSPQPTGSSPSLDDLWHRAYEHYGLMRPADVTERDPCLPCDSPVFPGPKCLYSVSY